jgi:hypothetical protein
MLQKRRCTGPHSNITLQPGALVRPGLEANSWTPHPELVLARIRIVRGRVSHPAAILRLVQSVTVAIALVIARTFAPYSAAPETQTRPASGAASLPSIGHAVRVKNSRSGQDVIEAAGRANGREVARIVPLPKAKSSPLKRTAIWGFGSNGTENSPKDQATSYRRRQSGSTPH